MINNQGIGSSRSPHAQHWVPWLVFLFGIWYFCLRITGIHLDYLPGDFVDSRFINYLLEHGRNWMLGKADSFWNASFMYPFQNTIGISDNMLGTMPIYAMFRAFGAGNETAYQLWWITVCSLNFWSAFYVLKKWFNRWDLAIIGAWIFAFTIFNLGQLNYVQMSIRFLVPIVIYASAKWVESSKTKYFVIYALALVFQFYSVIYTGFFLMYFSLGFMFLYAIITKEYWFFTSIFRRSELKLSIPVIFFCLISMAWLILPYWEISKILGMRMYDEVKLNIPLWRSYLFPQDSAQLWHPFTRWFKPKVDAWWLHQSFFGLIPLLGLLALPFVWFFKKIKGQQLNPTSLALILTSLILFALYIRTSSGYTLYVLLFKLPGMNSIRVIDRYLHVELFFIIAALISLLILIPRKYLAFIFILVILDNSFNPERMIRRPKTELQARREYTIREVEQYELGDKIAFAIIDSIDYHHAVHVDAMIASEHLQIPTINGYSSSGPSEFGAFFGSGKRSALQSWLNHNGIDSSEVLIIYRDSTKTIKPAY